MLILLGSPEYFQSNRLRELRTARENRLPLILVHDTELQKNGAPLDELKSACPAELHDYVFGQAQGEARQIIPWHRVTEFQVHVVLSGQGAAMPHAAAAERNRNAFCAWNVRAKCAGLEDAVFWHRDHSVRELEQSTRSLWLMPCAPSVARRRQLAKALGKGRLALMTSAATGSSSCTRRCSRAGKATVLRMRSLPPVIKE